MKTKPIIGSRWWVAGSRLLTAYEAPSYDEARYHRVIHEKMQQSAVHEDCMELADAGRDWLPDLCDVDENWLTKVVEAKMSREGSDWFYDG